MSAEVHVSIDGMLSPENDNQPPLNLEAVEAIDPAKEIEDIHILVADRLRSLGVSTEKIDQGEIKQPTVLHLLYWHNRLRNKPEEQQRIREHLTQYLGDSVNNSSEAAQSLLTQQDLLESSKQYVENLLLPTRTVDLVVIQANGEEDNNNKKILNLDRSYYPFGKALPGGFIKDTDEDNDLGVTPELFAALRVAGNKVLELSENARYERIVDEKGNVSFLVRGESDQPAIKIYPQDQGGYHYKENPRTILLPSDPRHIVDTVGFRCELIGSVSDKFTWRTKGEIMSSDEPQAGFAFGHHQEIVAYIASQTSLEKELQMQEREFVRDIINNPLEQYQRFKQRFEESDNPEMVSMPELFPAVNKFLTDMYSEEINRMCQETPMLAWIRDSVTNSLRQVSLKNRDFCPYRPTVDAIFKGVEFFDIVARHKRGLFENLPTDGIIEHNPRQMEHALYHTYRYTYRYNELLSKIPNIMVVPTSEPLSATDLLKVRGVPILFLGLSENFLYVDEFEQSPKEFYMHDANHSWRMFKEDEAVMAEQGKTREEFMAESNRFIQEYMAKIKILKTDTEEEKELKKLKKIILFEIVHEDARPFLKEIIGKYIQQKEGGKVLFEVPRIDPKTGYMDIVDTRDTGISTLSYVRNKLQHGFYDEVDSQLPQIVDPKYRTARWITRAAYEMLVELNITPEPGAELDDQGRVSFEWLLRRTCAVGPDNIHATDYKDPDEEEFGDGTLKVNPKRYQANENVNG